MKGFGSSAPMAIWAMLVLGGLAILIYWQPSAGPKATRSLSPNTLIQSTDLDWNRLVGRYVARPDGIAAGQTIRPDDLADAPLALTAPVKVFLTTTVQRSSLATGSVSSGKDSSLCLENKAVAKVRVISSRCPSEETTAECTAIAEFAGDVRDTAKLLSDMPPGARLRLAPTCS